VRILRSGCYAAYFFLVTLVFGLAGVFVRLFAREWALGLAQAWARVSLSGLRPICGIGLQVSGLHHLPAEGPALLASQHQSEFDTLVWMKLLRRPSYVMKQELLGIPLFGPMLVPAGMIPVDRADGARALRLLLKNCLTARAAGRQIVIFPEGTRVAPGERVMLQSGIAAISSRLGLPVFPVATDSGLRWSRGRLGNSPGPIHIAIGAPIAVGTEREVLLAEIEAHWRHCEINGFPAVDNSVGGTLEHASERPVAAG
jgi:1-acyl-sn-glycerol-3-phosphate acyltransferase